MEAALTVISGMFLMYFLLSVLCLSGLRGVCSCGGRHGLRSRLDLLWLLVFRFCLIQMELNKSEKRKRARPVSWASFRLFDQSEGVNLPISASLSFLASKRSVWFEQALRNKRKINPYAHVGVSKVLPPVCYI